ncbi:iron chaperone [Brochothrix campestris]|uniref:iron chaperone n=1 Tax=Brochothrix campestris TaxID=2757 RepID=UPI0038D1FC99
MAVFEAYIADLPAEHQGRVSEVLNWIATTYPQLEQEIKWKQPMFIDHGTFIIAFSVAKHHLAVAPEGESIIHFASDIAAANYQPGKKFMRIKWEQAVDYDLLKRIIEFNMLEKAACQTFWRS